ncbi:uncharacterized protein ACNS7B_016662 [Menidia menidia]
MSVWWQTLLVLAPLLNCVESSAPSFVQRCKYSTSFRLAKTTRTRVQHLLKKYKVQQLGNVHFEDRNRHLRGLPFLSTDFSEWLKLSDWDRLHGAFWDMQAYWNVLEGRRKQLEMEEKQRSAPTTLPQTMKHIQLDLRDLMNQVSNQMRFIRRSWIKPTASSVQMDPGKTTKTVWDSRVEGYILLRDLDLYLTKLARDFLLLASKNKKRHHADKESTRKH